MIHVLIDYDNGTWKASGLDDFQLRHFGPGVPFEERPPCQHLTEAGTSGQALDRLKFRVLEQAREFSGAGPHTICIIKYVYTPHAYRRYWTLREEHHARTRTP